ncbi:MAG: UDP-4-amino-4,6-dideoxy-N-acetyl-beta-L-altrosamine transaminase [Lachnospiraceae bacterium]|nr:UDP-4-amino-4,6-dideoxy-N-acetyl-beta-L-altrosamine transaminase [Lachnospiraceae bacterium]
MMQNTTPAYAGGTPVRTEKIYYAHQMIDQADIDAVAAVMRSDFLTAGPAIEETEKKLCELTGAKYAVLCANGTAALHIACLAAGIKEGDEVITTPITFAASANCALYCGATPVFADIDPETYQLDPVKVQEKITEKTKAIIPVDFGGQAADIDAFLKLAKEHGLLIIEDASHSIGTKYHGRAVGSLSDMTVFSFHPVKTICGGEGGAVLTDDEDLCKKLRLYRTHGITRDPAMMRHEPHGPWYYEQVALSTNYRITDMQAALIGSQLNKLPAFAARRKEICARYDEEFGKLPAFRVQKETEGSDTVRHLYILRIDPEHFTLSRRELYDALLAEGIVPNVHYLPVYRMPYYEDLGYKVGLCPEAERLYDEMLTLPLYAGMTDQDIEDVICAVTRIGEYYGR